MVQGHSTSVLLLGTYNLLRTPLLNPPRLLQSSPDFAGLFVLLDMNKLFHLVDRQPVQVEVFRIIDHLRAGCNYEPVSPRLIMAFLYKKRGGETCHPGDIPKVPVFTVAPKFRTDKLGRREKRKIHDLPQWSVTRRGRCVELPGTVPGVFR
jgi:hypothetical protein